MELLVLLALIGAATSLALPFDPKLNTHWENFMRLYRKSYSGKEEGARRLIWEGNIDDILHHNLAADMGLHSYKRGINEYADLTHKELLSKLTGLVVTSSLRSNGSAWVPPSNIKIPERVDWREAGAVTPVKNQEDCGSCWAFSTTGALEGQHQRKTGNLVSLSEQNLIDCARPEGTQGCNGGFMDDAFNYIRKNHGIDTEESYPYTARDGMCHFSKSSIGATCTGFMDIPEGDEEALLKAVAAVGPISVAIDASHRGFATYKSGIYDEPFCTRHNLNHGVLVVGYGTENGKDYWLIKNSWGESWGMNGYIKMTRNKNNQCGIASLASYPLV